MCTSHIHLLKVTPTLSLSIYTQTKYSSSALSATGVVDPAVVTKKEYQDICGVDFSDRELVQRLAKTSYLYPKHVEVIEDFTPMVDRMVDEIVSID